MRRMWNVVGLAVLAAVSFPAKGATPAVTITQGEGALQIAIDGQPFTTYHYAPSAEDPKWNRPYFYPVMAADKTPVTSDQWRLSQTEKTDHPWHRSLYVGWGDINGVDHWTLKEYQQRHVRFSKIEGDMFVEELAWDGKEPGKPIVSETRTVRILPFEGGSRGVDLTSVLTANELAVFKCKPLNVQGVEAGMIAVRVVSAISKDPAHEITTASGATGEKASRAQPAAWCDFSGSIHGAPYGIAIVTAPTDASGIMPWAVRDQGLFAQVGTLNFTLQKGESRQYRHLVLIHTGNATDAHIAEKAEAWRKDVGSK